MLYVAAFRESWYGRWGYGFGRAGFGIKPANWRRAATAVRFFSYLSDGANLWLVVQPCGCRRHLQSLRATSSLFNSAMSSCHLHRCCTGNLIDDRVHRLMWASAHSQVHDTSLAARLQASPGDTTNPARIVSRYQVTAPLVGSIACAAAASKASATDLVRAGILSQLCADARVRLCAHHSLLPKRTRSLIAIGPSGSCAPSEREAGRHSERRAARLSGRLPGSHGAPAVPPRRGCTAAGSARASCACCCACRSPGAAKAVDFGLSAAGSTL